jgi:3-oxoacyl-[acyl-carrier protein] reductase
MSEKLQNKVAIFTGASRVIGRAIAIRLAQDDGSVVVNCGKTKDEAEQVVAEIKKAGGRAALVLADVLAFLASNDARWITGQNIHVNGGIV